jgi:hypothetical protein
MHSQPGKVEEGPVLRAITPAQCHTAEARIPCCCALALEFAKA